MDGSVEQLIAQLATYIASTRAHFGTHDDQERYWRGVLFGLELALLESRKLGTSRETTPASSSDMYEAISKLIFDRLDQLITLCQAPIKRDLLVYNAKLARYELLRSVRQQAAISGPNEYEIQAHSDFE